MEVKLKTLVDTHRSLGLLAEPLGWLRAPLSRVVDEHPLLARDLLFLSGPRLHLLALATAHIPEPYDLSLLSTAVADSGLKVVRDNLGSVPPGLRSALRRIDHRAVLERESYRRLVELLRDSRPGILLHCPTISDSLIQTLAGCPRPLRKFVTYSAAYEPPLMLTSSLDYLVKLGMAGCPEDLVGKFAKFNQFSQIASAVQQFVEGLPLPYSVRLPFEIEASRQLTTAAELRAIADDWCNCLRSYIAVTDNGTGVIYLWNDESVQALCLLERVGRMGWFLDHILGPNNSDVPKDQEARIRSAFRSAGFDSSDSIQAIRYLLDFDTSKPHRHVHFRNGRAMFL